MSEIYEAYHRIVERLAGGEAPQADDAADGGGEALLNDKTRAAFIRGMEEELEPPGKFSHD
jgi:hypothetical protein